MARLIREFVTDELVGTYERMTVRQVFYKVEVAGIVAKSDRGYQQVQNQLLRMRREGVLDWGFITDGTRWQRKPSSWNNTEDYLTHVATTYRRDLWQSQDVRAEIWLEKDALADTVVDTTARWGVPLMVSRGQSSATFIYNAAKEAERAWEIGRIVTYIYALYDRDPGGERASRTIAKELPTYAPGVPIYFMRLAVTDEQVAEWNLPTRPSKASDPEAAKFTGPAVELDAIDPGKLNELVEGAITQHVDMRAWEVEEIVEREERRLLHALVDR